MKINQTQLSQSYAYQKPTPPIVAGFLLSVLSAVAFASLMFSAYEAFQNTTVNPWHALGLATGIEGGAIVTAFVWAKKGKGFGWETIAETLAAIIMIVVSGSYQYTQARQAAAGGNLAEWEVWVMAEGPLFAAVLVAVVLGNTINEHQSAVAVWQDKKDKWLAGKQAEAEAETKRLAEADLLRRQGIEDENKAIRDRADELERKRKAKQENRKQAQPPQLLPEVAGSGAEASGALPEWIDRVPEDIQDFVNMTKKGEARINGISGPKMGAVIGKSPRTGQKFLAAAKIELAKNGHNEKAVQNGK